MKPILLCIIGNKVYRYVNGIREKEFAEMNLSAPITIKAILNDLESFRKYGFSEEE